MLFQEGAEFRKQLEKKLGREILKEEFINPEFIESLKDLFWDDFVEMCDLVEDSGLIVV